MLYVALECLKLAEGESILCCSDRPRVLGVVIGVVVKSLLWGESTSPFIDEGDGLTSEIGRVYVCY